MEEVLINLETSLLQPDVRSDGAKLNDILAEEFVEISHTGQRITKDDILKQTHVPSTEQYFPEQFQVIRIASDVYQVRYYLKRENSTKPDSWRSSIWNQEGEAWKLLFHQGTVVAKR